MSSLSEDGEETSLLNSSMRISYGSPSLGKKLRAHKTRPISVTLRWATNATALLSVFLFSGIVFGWAPLKLILLDEGQYSDLCSSNNNNDNVPCAEQLQRYNLIFTVAQFLLSLASLPVGFFVDHCSKKIHYSVTCLLLVGGLALFASADDASAVPERQTVDKFVVAYGLMALGGCMTMIGAFPASFLLAKYQAGILAAVSCLFDASSVIFAIFAQLYSYDSNVFSRRHLFTAYSVIAILISAILGYCWFSLERRDWKVVALAETKERSQESLGEPELESSACNESSTLYLARVERLGFHDWSLQQQLRTVDFLLALCFASVHMTRCNFYIQSVNEMLEAYGDTDAYYANVFSFVLPVGVVFVPLIERTIHKLGVVRTLHLTNGLGFVFGALLLIPSLRLQAVNFVVFTCFRAFLYATINTFTAMTFGVTTMGRMIGFIFTTASIVTLLQYPAATWAEHHGNDFTSVNLLMVGSCAIPTAMAIFYSKLM